MFREMVCRIMLPSVPQRFGEDECYYRCDLALLEVAVQGFYGANNMRRENLYGMTDTDQRTSIF